MKELEVKILEINREKIEKNLIASGAKKVFDGDMQTIFFDFDDDRIAGARDVLRLRKEESKIELTYKKVHSGSASKEAEETSVEVTSLEGMQKILENIGLSVTESMLKHRISYKINDVRFDIDRYLGTYEFIPEFMEIEAENADSIYKFAELLDFQAKDCLPWTTYDIIQYYSSKKGKKMGK